MLASLATGHLGAQQLEQSALAAGRGGWRLLSHVYRAYFDATVQARLRFEQAREARAYEAIAVAAAATRARRLRRRRPRCANRLPTRRRSGGLAGEAARACGGDQRERFPVRRVRGGRDGGAAEPDPRPVSRHDRHAARRPAAVPSCAARTHRRQQRDRRKGRATRPAVVDGPRAGALYDQLGLSPRNARLDTGVGPEADPQYVFAPLIQFDKDETQWPIT